MGFKKYFWLKNFDSKLSWSFSIIIFNHDSITKTKIDAVIGVIPSDITALNLHREI